jgi:fructose-specific phosphotransferase system IIA component
VLTADRVLLNIQASGQEAAIRQMVTHAASLGLVRDTDAVVAAVLKREEEGTTGFGRGIAIPHGKSSAVAVPAVLFGRLAEPVDWKAMDGQPVHTLFLILVPEESHAEHLQILAKLARKLMHDEFVEKVQSLSDAEAISSYISAELA